MKKEKIKMTQEEWNKFEREQFNYLRKFMEGEDIDITPEGYDIEIVPSQQEKEEFWEGK